MILGFTGTLTGMTQKQRETVRYLFAELPLHVLHHGDCIGADANAHRLARHIQARIVIHPPSDDSKRANCWGADEVLEPRPYLLRNRDIIAAARDGLIATPKDYDDKAGQRGQGTWTTVGYARQAGLRIWIVYPDGTFKEEPARVKEDL